MTSPVEDFRLNFASPSSNADAYLGEGWHGAETQHRWTDGFTSVVRLPPLRASAGFLLTLKCRPLALGRAAQRLTVTLNGVELTRVSLDDYAVILLRVSGHLVSDAQDNRLVFDHPDAARPNEIEPGNPDDRSLALAFLSLECEALDDFVFDSPKLLPAVAPPTDYAEAKAMVEAFQSLGKNCDLGLLQRKFGAEPFGLLRFAAISPDRLTMALKTRFEGIGDVDKLTLFLEWDGRHYQGRHADYGLDYHTFLPVDATPVEELTKKEALRLKYLARLLIEQLENDEKIFLRQESFETTEEAVALHRLMRKYNPRARLFLVSLVRPEAPERVGRVVELRPGLYRGYLPRLSDPSRTPDRPIFEEWTPLCAAVLAYENARIAAEALRRDQPGYARDLRLVFAGADQNVEPLLGEGWRPAEAVLRQTDGDRSALKLPAMAWRPWFVLRLDASPLEGDARRVVVELNGVEAARYVHRALVPYDIVIPGERIRASGENDLVIRTDETGPLALAFRQISLETLEAPMHQPPLRLAPIAAPRDAALAKAVGEAFQSLGQHWDLGLFQRRYGAEPFGLLRFASIFPGPLIQGLKTRFAGVGDVDALSYYLTPVSDEWHGMHAVYGLAYHTFKRAIDVDAATLAAKEGPRLQYLARMLIEQLETDDKIFVRVEDFEAAGEALALHRLLQTFHPQATLLLLQAGAPEEIGRVHQLRPGLYRGFFSRPSDLGETRDPAMYEEWLRLCATVVAYDYARTEGSGWRSQAVLKTLGQAPARASRLIFEDEAQTIDPYLGEGWQGAEVGHRWTDGLRSVVRWPALQAQPWFALTLKGWSLDLDGAKREQPLAVSLNGTFLRRLRLAGGMPLTLAVPGDLVRADGENILALDHPEAARPSELQPGNGDSRLLSLAFQRLEIEPLDEPLFLAPRWLAKAEPEDAKAVADAFQSLGRSCDVGVFQRHYGAEPPGLLRFASIFSRAVDARVEDALCGGGRREQAELLHAAQQCGMAWQARRLRPGLPHVPDGGDNRRRGAGSPGGAAARRARPVVLRAIEERR